MVSRGGRGVAAVLAAVVAVVALSASWRSASVTPAASCAVPCATIAAAPDEAPCVSDAACAGHTSGSVASWVAEVAPVANVAAAALLAVVPRRRSREAWPGLLAAFGLYRPPRLSV